MKQIFLVMPTGFQLLKKFPTYYGIPRFTAAFTTSLPPLISILCHFPCKAVIYNTDFIAPPPPPGPCLSLQKSGTVVGCQPSPAESSLISGPVRIHDHISFSSLDYDGVLTLKLARWCMEYTIFTHFNVATILHA
jgi:hypothetical protein